MPMQQDTPQPQVNGFAILPRGLVTLWPSLPEHFIRVLPALASFMSKDGCYPSQKRIALLAHRHRVNVCKTLDQMTWVGLTTKSHRRDADRRNRNAPCHYAWAPGLDDPAGVDVIMSRLGGLSDRVAAAPNARQLEAEAVALKALQPEPLASCSAQDATQAVASKSLPTAVAPEARQEHTNTNKPDNRPDGGADAPSPFAAASGTPSVAANAPVSTAVATRDHDEATTAAAIYLTDDDGAYEPWDEDVDGPIPLLGGEAEQAPSPAPAQSAVRIQHVGYVPPPRPPGRKRKGGRSDEDDAAIRKAGMPALIAWLGYGMDGVYSRVADWPRLRPSRTNWFTDQITAGITKLEPDRVELNPDRFADASSATKAQVAGWAWMRLNAMRAERGLDILLPTTGGAELMGNPKRNQPGILGDLYESRGPAGTIAVIRTACANVDLIRSRFSSWKREELALDPGFLRHGFVVKHAAGLAEQMTSTGSLEDQL